MNVYKTAFAVMAAMTLGACEGAVGGKNDKSYDSGFDGKPLSELKAGIWIDPNGCDHWIIDDGIEGYMDPRLDPYGKPVCSGAGAGSTAVGDYKGGSLINDPI